MLVLVAVVVVVAAASAVPDSIGRPLFNQTHGLVNVAWLAWLVIVICGSLLFLGRRQPLELGLVWQDLPSGLLA
jgi:hypothetical protein